MFHSERWFAWFPVTTRNGGTVWLQTVIRERSVTPKATTPWRYYATTN